MPQKKKRIAAHPISATSGKTDLRLGSRTEFTESRNIRLRPIANQKLERVYHATGQQLGEIVEDGLDLLIRKLEKGGRL